MAHDIKQSILLLSKHDNAATNKEIIEKVANKMFANANVSVKAAGLIGQGVASDMNDGIIRRADAVVELANSVTDLHTLNDTGVDTYGDMAKVIMEQNPDNPEAWLEFLVEVSEGTTTDGTVPGKVVGGSIVQSEYVGQGLMHYHKCAGAQYYKVWESQNPDPSVMADYYRANPDSFPNCHGGLVTVKNTGIKTWHRVQACNVHGAGIMSDAFGGISYSPTI